MLINGRILTPSKSESEEMLEAMEAVKYTRKFTEEYTLRDKYFPYIESFLPKSERLLFRHIAAYEDKWNDILSSPYPCKLLPFGNGDEGEDNDIIFKVTQIDRDELQADIKKVPLPNNLEEKAAFQPLQVTMYLMLRYYLVTKQPKKAEALYPYYGYSIYWKRFNKSFSRFAPDEGIMVYTINEMTYRNLIKKLGSLRALLAYVVQHAFEYYREEIANSCDEDIRYVLDRVQSDIGSKMNEIAKKYYANYEKRNTIMKSEILFDNDGTQREDRSITASAEILAQKYTNKFFSESIDRSIIRKACSMSGDASPKEIEVVLDQCHSSTPVEEVQDFYASMFYYYLIADPKNSVDTVNSLRFMSFMRDVIKKGNSKDTNIMKIIYFVNKWLEEGSNRYRVTTREGTRSGYKKALYLYFMLSVKK